MCHYPVKQIVYSYTHTCSPEYCNLRVVFVIAFKSDFIHAFHNNPHHGDVVNTHALVNVSCKVIMGSTKGVYREEGMQLTMYRTYSSNFVSETGYANPVYGREQVGGVIYGVIIMGVYIRAAFAS